MNEILIDGCRLLVRDNLFRFLVEARRTGLSDWLWIDAISIDQFNTAERNVQVRRMSSIYSEASEVFVWLDPGPVHSESALTESDIDRVARISFPRAFTDAKNPSSELSTCLEVVPVLVDNSYFDRMWVISEITLARSLCFLSVGICYSFTTFKTLLRIYKTHFIFRKGETGRRLVRIQHVEALIMRQSDRSFLSLHDLARSIQGLRRECEDPRDRIYSILGITSDARDIDVDYSENLEDLCVRIVKILYGTSSATSAAYEAANLAGYLGLDKLPALQPFGPLPRREPATSPHSRLSVEHFEPHALQYVGTAVSIYASTEKSWTHWFGTGEFYFGIELALPCMTETASCAWCRICVMQLARASERAWRQWFTGASTYGSLTVKRREITDRIGLSAGASWLNRVDNPVPTHLASETARGLSMSLDLPKWFSDAYKGATSEMIPFLESIPVGTQYRSLITYGLYKHQYATLDVAKCRDRRCKLRLGAPWLERERKGRLRIYGDRRNHLQEADATSLFTDGDDRNSNHFVLRTDGSVSTLEMNVEWDIRQPETVRDAGDRDNTPVT
jgi:hypothetical protein